MRDGEVGTQLRPGRASVGGSHEILIAREQLAPAVPRRKDARCVEPAAQLERGILVRPDFYPLFARIGDLRDAGSAREDDVGILRIGKARAPLPTGPRLPAQATHRPPA